MINDILKLMSLFVKDNSIWILKILIKNIN